MRHLGLILFLLLPILYCVIYAPYGFNDTDQGFVQALAWRVLQGEVPYVDFDYVRPPVTLYLHALEMWALPEGHEVLGARCIMFVMLWATVLFTALSFKRVFGWVIDLRFWLVSCMAFVLTVHNYPPMPWHTIDSIFFVALGAWLLTLNGKVWNLACGMLSLLLAALCKQPFALMPLLALPVVALLHGRRALAVSLSSLAVAGALLLLSAWLIHPPFLGAMLEQVTGSTTLADLLTAGVLKYGWGVLLALPLIGVSLAPPAMRRWAGWVMPLLVLGIAFSLHIWRSFSTETWVGPQFHFFQALWVSAAFHALRSWFRSRQPAWALVLLTLAGAWVGSISWGYQTPAQYAAPIWLGVILLFSGETHLRLPSLLHAGLLVMGLGTYYCLYQFPYRDSPRSTEYVHLGEVEPKLQGIYTGQAAARNMASLRSLLLTHKPASWTVFPSMPLAHYLHNAPNPLPSDWEHNCEMYSNEEKWVQQLNKVQMVFVERDRLAEIGSNDRYACERCKLVTQGNWMLTDPHPASPFLISTQVQTP